MARLVLANSVEHDDRVVHREADHREHCGHEQRIHLDAEEGPEDREGADDHDHVVQHRHKRGDAELHVTETERDPQQDADRADEDQHESLLDQVGADHRANSRQLRLSHDLPEPSLERGRDVAQLPAGRHDRNRGRRRTRAW